MMKTEALLGRWTVPVDRPVEENTREFSNETGLDIFLLS